MDADTEGQQRKNVSVKSNCYRTAQRELILDHTLCSQPPSSALTATQKEKFPAPLKLQILLLGFLTLFILTNPEFRNPQTTPSKKHWIFFFFHKAFPPCNMMLQPTKAEKNGDDKNTHIIPPWDLGALWPSRLNLKFDNPTEIIKAFICSSCVQRSVYVNLVEWEIQSCLKHVYWNI
jgi:hypothetical protein